MCVFAKGARHRARPRYITRRVPDLDEARETEARHWRSVRRDAFALRLALRHGTIANTPWPMLLLAQSSSGTARPLGRKTPAAQQPSPCGFSRVDRTAVIELGPGGRHRAVARKARRNRPDHEREDTGKEAEAEVAVFAETIENCDERNQE